MLGEEANPQPRVLADKTLSWLKLTSKQFQHRSFTSTVRSNDTNTGIKLDIEVDILEERHFRRVPECDFGHLHNRWRELLDFGELEVHGVLSLWGIQDGHLFKFLDSGLRFRGLGSVVTELVDEG